MPRILVHPMLLAGCTRAKQATCLSNAPKPMWSFIMSLQKTSQPRKRIVDNLPGLNMLRTWRPSSPFPQTVRRSAGTTTALGTCQETSIEPRELPAQAPPQTTSDRPNHHCHPTRSSPRPATHISRNDLRITCIAQHPAATPSSTAAHTRQPHDCLVVKLPRCQPPDSRRSSSSPSYGSPLPSNQNHLQDYSEVQLQRAHANAMNAHRSSPSASSSSSSQPPSTKTSKH